MHFIFPWTASNILVRRRVATGWSERVYGEVDTYCAWKKDTRASVVKAKVRQGADYGQFEGLGMLDNCALTPSVACVGCLALRVPVRFICTTVSLMSSRRSFSLRLKGKSFVLI